MEKFLENLKRQAEENPTATLATIAGLLAAGAKLIGAHGQHKGSRAYARDVERRIKRDRNK